MAQVTLNLPDSTKYMDIAETVQALAEKLDCDIRYRASREFVLVPKEKRADVVRLPTRLRAVSSPGPNGAA
ncbi:hypothetical protein [Marinobacter sp. JSM 1782161]|uniref:hypothetical protein n=1 Tax=Marinobacter sp. JSM 1782161 TaxID=2685906 RepID=UPI001402678D|nr:hypothetical protein [Marinobacter sp. JSM 1782161]